MSIYCQYFVRFEVYFSTCSVSYDGRGDIDIGILKLLCLISSFSHASNLLLSPTLPF